MISIASTRVIKIILFPDREKKYARNSRIKKLNFYIKSGKLKHIAF